MSRARRPWPAAFFDLDGTLLPGPSLERRLLRFLHERGEWSPAALGRWTAQFLKHAVLGGMAPRGERLLRAIHGNKTYWKNLPTSCVQRFLAERGLPEFFPQALLRIAWHAAQGHRIFLVTGTLRPLAVQVAKELRGCVQGAWTGIAGVCATRLEERDGRWTGEILGEAVCAIGKARAVEHRANEHALDLGRSFAYGNSAFDRSMLASVGNPVAVNPSRALRRIARVQRWPILSWSTTKIETSPAAENQKVKASEFELEPTPDWQGPLERKA